MNHEPQDASPEKMDSSGKVETPEVSVVMPCLNEADTLEVCIEKARQALQESGISGEIIVADNGSTDDSPTIAARLGVRLVRVEERGYGSALMGGIEAARGTWIIMGDADDSYDFHEIPRFVAKLRQGYDLVQGCRLASGGGKIMPGAMSFLHRRIGNPLFSWIVRTIFWTSIHDVYCGLRGFSRELYDKLHLRCLGMEFATEMIIKAGLLDARIAEIPITLFPDGRKAHPPHLRTFRDGWQTICFMLIYRPRWLFLYPGAVFILLGLIGYGIALPGLTIGRITFDAHTLVVASLALLLGYQAILFAVFAKTFAAGERMLPEDRRLARFFEVVTLKHGLIGGLGALVTGTVLLLVAVNQWRVGHFEHLDYARTMRWVVPGATLIALGFQTVLASFFVGVLRMKRR